MAPKFEFGELKNDNDFTQAVSDFNNKLDKVEKTLTTAVEFNNFDELSTQDKVKLDNYLAYSINSLYWMYVKLQGLDPNEHDIKNELSRVRQSILRDKEIYERNTKRPILDKEAAGRFIKHGLQIGRDENNEGEDTNMPKNKKIKFNTDSE